MRLEDCTLAARIEVLQRDQVLNDDRALLLHEARQTRNAFVHGAQFDLERARVMRALQMVLEIIAGPTVDVPRI